MKYSHKRMTAGEITEGAGEILAERNCETWRHNQIPQRGRTFKGRRGVSDRIGFHIITGVFVACEVKTDGDRLSKEQKNFLLEVRLAGGIALVAIQNEMGFVELIDYLSYIK